MESFFQEKINDMTRTINSRWDGVPLSAWCTPEPQCFLPGPFCIRTELDTMSVDPYTFQTGTVKMKMIMTLLTVPGDPTYGPSAPRG